MVSIPHSYTFSILLTDLIRLDFIVKIKGGGLTMGYINDAQSITWLRWQYINAEKLLLPSKVKKNQADWPMLHKPWAVLCDCVDDT